MKTISKNIKYIISITFALILMVLLGFGLFPIQQSRHKTEATSGISPETITNANFDSSPSSSYPFTPSGFSSSDSASDRGVKAGVVSLNKYAYAQNSGDDYALMIESLSHNYFGYTTNSTITLKADSYYMVSVDVLTDKMGLGLITLNQDDNVYTSMSSISSERKWTTCTFLIKTNQNSDSKIKIGMYLTGKGIVLFDNLYAAQLSSNVYSTISTNLDTQNEKHLDVDKTDKVLSTTNLSTLFPEAEVVTDEISNDTVVSSAVKLSLKNSGQDSKETADNFITIEQNKIYRVSVFAKTMNLNGQASLQLIETGSDKNNSTDILKITSDTTSTMNGYQVYDFYIKGYSNQDTTYKLKFALGDKDKFDTTGDLYVSRVRIYNVTTSTFSSLSTSSTKTKKDLSADATNVSDFMVKNGNFNDFEITDLDKPFPASAKNFNVTTGNRTQYHGVINTRDFNGIEELNGTYVNPYDPKDSRTKGNNNVLMMYNASADTLIYESETKNLSANSYHRFNMLVQTQGSRAKVELVSKDLVLASQTITTGIREWQDVDFYIHSGYQSMDVAVRITLTTEDYGYTFVDDIYYDKITDLPLHINSIEDAYNSNTITSDNLLKVDLSNLLSNKEFMGAKDAENITTSIVDITNDSIILNNEKKQVFSGLESDNKNALLIRATGNAEYKITSNIGFALSADKYYKLSVSVYNQKRSTNLVENDNLSTVDISLSNFEKGFTRVSSYDEWTTYNFYICPTSATTTYLTFNVQSKDEAVLSDTFIADIKFDDNFDEESFNLDIETNVIKLKEVTKEAEEEPKVEEETTNEKNNSSWLYILPTVLTFVAIVGTVLLFVLKKVNWKKRGKKVKIDYARDKNFSKQVYLRKANALREEKYVEIKKSLEELLEERSKFEEEYKTTIAKVRDLKIKRGDINEINKLEHELNKNRKASSHIGMKISKIEEEIQYMQTDAYLNNLAKKLAKHSSEETDKEDQ